MDPFEKQRAALLKLLSDTHWFCNVGTAAEGADVHPISNWEDWPGADNPLVIALHQDHERIYEKLGIDGNAEKKSNWNRIVESAVEHSSEALRIKLAARESWEPMSTACWQAAWTAAIVTEMASIRQPIPMNLFIQWRWFIAGHWPAAYASDNSEALIVL